MANTYAHHFFARGCELAGCDAPDGRCDLYLIADQRRAVRACCGDHARACADLDAWLDAHHPDLGIEWDPEEAR
jgi:hypothetical protein